MPVTTGKNILWKEEIAPQYFQYTSNFKNLITNIFVANRIIFSSILQIWYVEVRISRSISESPLEFEITRVDCTLNQFFSPVIAPLSSDTSHSWKHKLRKKKKKKKKKIHEWAVMTTKLAPKQENKYMKTKHKAKWTAIQRLTAILKLQHKESVSVK